MTSTRSGRGRIEYECIEAGRVGAMIRVMVSVVIFYDMEQESCSSLG